MPRAVIFAPDSGNQYKEFQREAQQAAQFFGAEVHYFPASLPEEKRREFVLAVLRAPRAEKLAIVAFLCHGFRNRIQAGFGLQHVKTLAASIASVTTEGASVPLYCCSTGKGPSKDGEGSFADALRDALVSKGMKGGKIFAHTSAGHLSRNPEARVYEIKAGVLGGTDVAPRMESKDLYARWRGLLHTPTGRWQVATMADDDIEQLARSCQPWVDPPRR